jgi:hypothetical protein
MAAYRENRQYARRPQHVVLTCRHRLFNHADAAKRIRCASIAPQPSILLLQTTMTFYAHRPASKSRHQWSCRV